MVFRQRNSQRFQMDMSNADVTSRDDIAVGSGRRTWRSGTNRVRMPSKNGPPGAIMVLRTNASWSEGRPERGHRHVSILWF